jgi:hypothetical protein
MQKVLMSLWRARVMVMALLLGGCRGVALSPEDFRQQMASSAEHLDVDRPLRDVGPRSASGQPPA